MIIENLSGSESLLEKLAGDSKVLSNEELNKPIGEVSFGRTTQFEESYYLDKVKNAKAEIEYYTRSLNNRDSKDISGIKEDTYQIKSWTKVLEDNTAWAKQARESSK